MDTGFDTSSANETLQQIGEALVNNPECEQRDWQSLAVVSIIEPGASHLSGYTFDADGNASPFRAGNDDTMDLFEALQAGMQAPGKAPWVSALFQIRRQTMKFDVDFEYDDAMRWKVTPDRMDAVIAAIRPA